MRQGMGISEVRERTGVASSALRFYERKGLVSPTGRDGGGRVYGEEIIEQLALIDLLKLAGFTLAEIAAFAAPDGTVAQDWRQQAKAKLAELDERLEEIQRARTILDHAIKCPHPALDTCPVHQRIVKAHADALADRPAR